ncbi:MarR family winged helix-turn-helix transcriptional regulator [Rhodoferax ferrireducens]|uniref:MarR family winged helix-turn-helix transcriptional regulator n=1 Tax=Rhodoferax ferrireducens TaxID=192843 RepID=UPI00298E62B8|nr:MarR family winged helix-turn-helix transcriptional regulator [Rhodoferax ferrireducens]WPC66854.1 MarR family winged helix-turn-helix transcriptional regulator [Rhodoferax ferrireducens]
MTLPTQPNRSLRGDAASALNEDLAWNARLAARLLTAALDQGLKASGLTSTQFGLMCLIASSPDDTVGGLAARGGLNQSTMSRNIDALSRAGLVEVATVNQDRRRRAMWLTEAGLMRLNDAMPLWRSAQQALAARLKPQLAQHLSGVKQVLAPGPAA